MVLHSDNCCYTYIRPILHAMGQDDMITYIQVHTLPVDIRYHDMVQHQCGCLDMYHPFKEEAREFALY